MIPQLDLSSFKDWRDSTAAATPAALPVVLDVREPWELQTASVQTRRFSRSCTFPCVKCRHDWPSWKDTYGSAHPIACLCHHGMRSLQVGNFLEQRGFTEVVNLQGGIDAWSHQVDATVARY